MLGFYSTVFDWQNQWQIQRLELLNQLCYWLWEGLAEAPDYATLNFWQNMPDIRKTHSKISDALADPRSKTIKQHLLQGSVLEQLHRLAEICERSAQSEKRKTQGIFYTPQNLAAFMVNESINLLGSEREAKIQGRSILDPACGAGRLLWQLLWFRRQYRPEAPLKPWVQALVGVDLDPQALDIAAFGIHFLWQHFAIQEGPCPSLRLFAQDALSSTGNSLNLADQLEPAPLILFLSNPPYVGEKNNQKLFSGLKSGYWQKHYRGRGDLYYYFFHLALDLSQPDSVACLLTPAYFTQATAAEYLRSRLKTECQLSQCVDFGSWRIFQQAQGLQSFLCFFQSPTTRTPNSPPVTRVYTPLQTHFQLQLPLTQQLSKPREIETQQLFQAHNHRINVGSGHRQFQVFFDQGPQLSDYFEVKQGLVSGADKVSMRHLSRLQSEGEHTAELRLHQGIYVLDASESAVFSQHSDSPLVPWFKNSDILPFLCKDPTQKLIYAGREHTLPDIFMAHLSQFKAILSWRREVILQRIPWWQLQWPRTPALFTRPAVVLPQRAKRLRAALSPGGSYASADVYFIQALSQAEASPDLKELCLLLNAPVISYWFYHWGKRKGTLLEIYQEPLCSVPLPHQFGQSDVAQLWTQMTQHSATDLRVLHDWACQRFQLPEECAAQIWQWYVSEN